MKKLSRFATLETGIVLYREVYAPGRWFSPHSVSEKLGCGLRTARRLVTAIETVLPLEVRKDGPRTVYRRMVFK